MSVPASKPSKKNKLSPTDTELGSEFYVATKAKTSRTTKGSRHSQSQNSMEEEDTLITFSKDSIPFITKQIFSQRIIEETKEVSTLPVESQDPVTESVPQTIDSDKMSVEVPEAIPDIQKILDDEFLPKFHLYRDHERKQVTDFIAKCLKQNRCQSLLVSGPPGCGKSVVLTHLLEWLEEYGQAEMEQAKRDDEEWVNGDLEGFNTLKLNAALCENPSAMVLEIIRLINNGLPPSILDYKHNSKVLIDKLKQIILTRKSSKFSIVMIDNLDHQLMKQNVKEITELLRVPNYPFSNIVFIGVTNIPELQPKLLEQHKISLQLEEVIFLPYTKEEMLNIFKSRLEYVESQETRDELMNINWDDCLSQMRYLHETDVRYLFRIIRKAYREKPSQPSKNIQITAQIGETQENAICIDEPEQNAICIEEPPHLTNQDILRVYEEFYDDTLSPIIASLSQKHLMCLGAIVTLYSKKKSYLVSKKDLLINYNNICGLLMLPKTDSVNLVELLSDLEVQKIVELKPKVIDPSAPVAKTPAKNASTNEEYLVLVSPDKIRMALLQDSYFYKIFAE